jgi:hypothetical protein
MPPSVAQGGKGLVIGGLLGCGSAACVDATGLGRRDVRNRGHPISRAVGNAPNGDEGTGGFARLQWK